MCDSNLALLIINVHCNTLQHTATHWQKQRINQQPTQAEMCNSNLALLLFTAYRNTLQHTATYCNILQHTATYCNTLPHICTQTTQARNVSQPEMSYASHVTLLFDTPHVDSNATPRCITLHHTAARLDSNDSNNPCIHT